MAQSMNPAARFAEAYRHTNCTWAALAQVAPCLIDGSGDIVAADFWNVFGDLDRDFNQREMDKGHLISWRSASGLELWAYGEG